MSEKLSAATFDTLPGLHDWRFLLGRIEAHYRAGSFAAAAALVGRIAGAADAADHHPDLDVRYPDRVHVALRTHAAGGLTSLDVELAGTISGIAAAAGATSEPLTSQSTEIGIDAIDIPAIRPFWRAVLGYVDDGDDALSDPLRIGPPVWFQQMDEPRPQRNRIHLDVTVPHDVAEERVAAAIAAGGTLVSDRYARSWWVLADSEGNEACVCTWQDRSTE